MTPTLVELEAACGEVCSDCWRDVPVVCDKLGYSHIRGDGTQWLCVAAPLRALPPYDIRPILVVAIARAHCGPGDKPGAPYEWGGSDGGRYDCSGFVCDVRRDAGYEVTRVNTATMYATWERVTQPQATDVALYGKVVDGELTHGHCMLVTELDADGRVLEVVGASGGGSADKDAAASLRAGKGVRRWRGVDAHLYRGDFVCFVRAPGVQFAT